jgi:membrane associated rhomboid family serine protease
MVSESTGSFLQQPSRSRIWIPMSLIPAFTIFPVIGIFDKLEESGHPLSAVNWWGALIGLGATWLTLSIVVKRVEHLQHRVDQLEAKLKFAAPTHSGDNG